MYAKLIFRNAKRSAKDYLVYIITMTLCVMLFYAFLSISSSNYQPDIGSEYNVTMLGSGMKAAICGVTLLLLFLIRYVNSYMLRRKQKEFAVQSVMGMEQKTIGWLFFAETFVMGAVAIVIGIFLGVICSQFITAMLLSSYGQDYKLSWTLFPDTVLLTICFFALSLFVVGLFNVRTIRKIKIIDMLYADKQNEPHLKKSRYMPVIAVLFNAILAWMVFTGVVKKHFYFDVRFAFPVHIMFWGNIIIPAFGILWSLVWLVRHKKWGFDKFVIGQCLITILNACFLASVPQIQSKYYVALGTGNLNQYLIFILADLIFLICGVIYLASSLLVAWKEKSLAHKYQGQNLFFFGQIISKLQTTTKTMTLICLTLVLSIFLFIAAPALTGWASGYLDIRSMYDVQISTRYNDVYDEADLPRDNYELVTEFLEEHNIETSFDRMVNLYLPNKSDFHNRVKLDFPVVAMSLSDYNALREMLGMEQISLKENEFTTQWQSIATEDERTEFLSSITTVSTDAGDLVLAETGYYDEPIGETVYNDYTDVVYIFPDIVCKELLSVMKNRYIITAEPVSYDDTKDLEAEFCSVYPESAEGVHYYMRTHTQQVNSTKAEMFVLKASMTYGAVVLMVICLTILALQQLLDATHYRYRFGVLRKLGVEESEIDRLVLKQLAVWFGLPIVVAILISLVVIFYFFQMISVQISAYLGFGALMTQVGIIVGILILLLLCYFISTWILFKRSISEN